MLESVYIPGSVEDIGEYAFYDCQGLKNVYMGEGVKNIRAYAFCSCENITEIRLPDNLVEIGEGAFNVCYALTKINIPKSVMSIGNLAFMDCYNLKNIYYGGSESEWSSITDDAGTDPCIEGEVLFNTVMPGKPEIFICGCADTNLTVKCLNCDDLSATIVLAVCDKNGALRFMSEKKPAKTVVFDGVDLKDSDIKIMLWSDFDGIRPLADYVEMSL